MMNIETILEHYLSAVLWTEQDEIGYGYGTEDVTQDSIDQARKDIIEFTTATKHLLDEWDDEQIGHDIWLTRNGHGTGFWDRDLPNGREISDICEKVLKTCNVFELEGKVFIERG